MKSYKFSLGFGLIFGFLILYFGLIRVNGFIGQDGTPGGDFPLDPTSIIVGAVIGIAIGAVIGKILAGRKHKKTGHVSLLKRGEEIPTQQGRGSEESINPIAMDKGLRRGIDKKDIKRVTEEPEPDAYKGDGIKMVKDQGNGNISQTESQERWKAPELNSNSDSALKGVDNPGKKDFKGHVTLLK